MKIQRTSVGLDVHARSVVGCGLDGETGEVFQQRLTPDYGEIVASSVICPVRWRWPMRRARPGLAWPER